MKSDADGMGFFLAGRRGRTDPEAEMEATLSAISAPPVSGVEHAQCRFPARHHWLREQLGIDSTVVPEQPCPELDRWRTILAADSVALVYATAYISSPASMYGHTLLRLTRSTTGGHHLLDYAVSFAADVTTKNGLVYALKGVTGGFDGRFYVLPFYMKVQEYSNLESRDMWEYPLALSPAQITRLVEHTWETKETHFDYYFFTENCSYQLLALLEAAAPELRLLDGFRLRVIPSDTVRAVLAETGLSRGRVSRPSLAASMLARRAELRGPERAIAASVARGDHPGVAAALEPVPVERRALVLDSALDYFHYREGYSDAPSEQYARREQELLLARGSLGVPSPSITTAAGVGPPEAGHGTMRLAVGGGVSGHGLSRDQSFTTLTWRGALHDFLDQPDGYPPESVLEMGHVRLRLENERRALVPDRVVAVDVLSAPPFDRWLRKPAWGVLVGWDNARDLPCLGWRCGYFGLRTAFGIAASPGSAERGLFLLMMETSAAAGPAFERTTYVRAGVSARALAVVTLVRQRWRLLLEGRYAFYLLGARGLVPQARVMQSLRLSHMFELRAGAALDGAYREASAELGAYF